MEGPSKYFISFSPNAKSCASVQVNTLKIYNVENLNVLYEYIHPGIIEKLVWSPDSEHIFCTSSSQLHVLSLEHQDWMCQLRVEEAELKSANWAPDSKTILTTLDNDESTFGIVWCTTRRKVRRVLKKLKSSFPIFAFSPNGSHLAALEQSSEEEAINLRCCQTWKSERKLFPGTNGIEGITWSPESHYICAWKTTHITVWQLDGSKVAEIKLTNSINFVVWPGELFVACMDNAIYLVNEKSWTVASKLQMSTTFESLSGCNVLGEVQLEECAPTPRLTSTALASQSSSHDLTLAMHLDYKKLVEADMIEVVPDPSDECKCGVSQVVSSSDNVYVACLSDKYPTVVWIWETQTLKLTTVLKHQSCVSCMEWEPGQHRLHICTSSRPTPCLFSWAPTEPSAIPVPQLAESFLSQDAPSEEGSVYQNQELNLDLNLLAIDRSQREASASVSTRSSSTSYPHSNSSERTAYSIDSKDMSPASSHGSRSSKAEFAFSKTLIHKDVDIKFELCIKVLHDGSDSNSE